MIRHNWSNGRSSTTFLDEHWEEITFNTVKTFQGASFKCSVKEVSTGCATMCVLTNELCRFTYVVKEKALVLENCVSYKYEGIIDRHKCTRLQKNVGSPVRQRAIQALSFQPTTAICKKIRLGTHSVDRFTLSYGYGSETTIVLHVVHNT